MNSAAPSPTDARLQAWLDGELPPPERAAVETWLQAHPEEAARVRLWAADRDALRQRLDAELAEPLPEAWVQRLQAAPANDSRWRRPALAAALALATGLAGFAAGRWSGADTAVAAATPWVQRAAAAHAVYVPEKRHPVEVSVRGDDGQTIAAQEQHLAAWLTKRLTVPVKLFDLQARGYQLVGGRLLPDGGAPGAQLMYERADGGRVTVYLRKPEAGTPAAFQYREQDGLGQFYWVEGGAGYALTGALPKAELLALAEAIYQQGTGQGVGDNAAHGPR